MTVVGCRQEPGGCISFQPLHSPVLGSGRELLTPVPPCSSTAPGPEATGCPAEGTALSVLRKRFHSLWGPPRARQSGSSRRCLCPGPPCQEQTQGRGGKGKAAGGRVRSGARRSAGWSLRTRLCSAARHVDVCMFAGAAGSGRQAPARSAWAQPGVSKSELGRSGCGFAQLSPSAGLGRGKR